ncbi:hypothetical protein [Sphaerochaeta sp. PS]|uniref:hypothetical protein n=1 Tax=Sphaerochaeta sp. PS TaxID=3076336 RepID=UPI0028A562F8|nr:hypothetical protein [Sphaerochaeta sp. PS]MDT4763236.1 hypothetical protein [Sphaerochaeta sp. PS]
MKKKILITVLTYPTPSHKYIETVCTAGITEEGEWIRIYPIKLRLLNEKIQKYHWYVFDIEPRPRNKDNRKESYFCISPPPGSIGNIGTENSWAERRRLCLKNVFYNYQKLMEASDPKGKDFISLATFKPKELIDFIAEPKDVKKDELLKEEILQNLRNQGELMERQDIPQYWKMSQSIPYTFYYEFTDDSDTVIRLMIEDWELMMLYRNCRRDGEAIAIEKVKNTYLREFKKKELYFFLGTRREAHVRCWKKPYSIIGVFYPPKELQISFDL